MEPAELVARYDDSVHRVSRRTELRPERWASVRTRGDRDWGVGALVETDGSVLLVREDGQWLLPGGMLEPDETPSKGAAREVGEETGVGVDVTGLLAISEQTFVHAGDGREFDFHFATFGAVPVTTTPTDDPGLDGEGIEDVEWHDSLPENTFDRDLVARLKG